jgi:hypothetical protein
MAASDGTTGDGSALSEARHELGREGRRIVSDVKDDAWRFADRKKVEAAGLLHDVSEAVSTASDEMRRKGHDRAASCVDYVAKEAGLLAEQLDRRSLDGLLDDIDRFARRQPGLFYGVSLLAGFAAIRFLKSRGDGTGSH